MLKNKDTSSGVLILREIRPEYAVPVGVWQIREGIRAAMTQKSHILQKSFFLGWKLLILLVKRMSITKSEWMPKGSISQNVEA